MVDIKITEAAGQRVRCSVACALFLYALVSMPSRAAQRPGTASAPSTAEIIAMLHAGEPTQALALTSAQLHAFPHDCKLWSLKGVELQALDRTSESLHGFQRALSFCPTYLPALEGAAQLTFAAHAPEARLLLQRILAIRPEDPTTHAMLASVLVRDGDCAAAMSHFSASEPLFATHPQLLGDYGACLGQMNRWSEAITAFSELVRLQPDNQSVRSLATAQWRAGQPQQALATLQPLLQQGSDEHALVLGSSIAESSGDTARSVSLLRAAILANPDDVDNYLAFARLAQVHASFQVGVDLINVGITRLPDAAALYVARGVLYVQLSKFSDAEADFQRAHQLDPKLSLAMDAIGILQEQQHESAASLTLFRQQAALHPRDPLLQYLLAEGLSESDGGSLTEAIAAARRACALEPGYQPAIDLLANLYLRTNQFDEAIRQSKLALVQNPNDVSALFVEIRAKGKLGDKAGLADLAQRLRLAEKASAVQEGNATRYRLTETPASSQ